MAKKKRSTPESDGHPPRKGRRAAAAAIALAVGAVVALFPTQQTSAVDGSPSSPRLSQEDPRPPRPDLPENDITYGMNTPLMEFTGTPRSAPQCYRHSSGREVVVVNKLNGELVIAPQLETGNHSAVSVTTEAGAELFSEQEVGKYSWLVVKPDGSDRFIDIDIQVDGWPPLDATVQFNSVRTGASGNAVEFKPGNGWVGLGEPTVDMAQPFGTRCISF